MIHLTLTDDQIRAIAQAVAELLPDRHRHPAPPPEVYTVEDAGAILGLHPRTVARRVQAGIIRKVPGLGTAVRIPAAEIKRLTEAS